MDRRSFLNSTTVLGSLAIAAPRLARAQTAPAVITRDAMRPQMAHGIQSGDPTSQGAVIWTRCDRPARLWLEWATTASFAN
ncbi:MAG: PhoD-like phosphatase N-terminal domain-containing protein, partial [Rhodoferax sp.]